MGAKPFSLRFFRSTSLRHRRLNVGQPGAFLWQETTKRYCTQVKGCRPHNPILKGGVALTLGRHAGVLSWGVKPKGMPVNRTNPGLVLTLNRLLLQQLLSLNKLQVMLEGAGKG